MTSGRRKALTWLLSGAAFVIVMMSAGCARFKPAKTDVSWTQPEPTTQPVLPEVQPDPEPQVQPSPPMVNVFGEFDGIERTEVRSVGPASFQQHTFTDEGYDGDVAVDPKGQWLVFSSTRHSEHADIYLQRVDGLSVIQLTSDEADDAFPVFSPDGARIAFCSTRAGNWDIYVMDRDGRNSIQVTNSPMHEIHPSFSPDGNRLVYCALSNRSGQWELWTVNLQNGEKRMIGLGLFPAWSPAKDRDQIAFQKARARGSRWFSIWTMDLVDGEARRVTEVAVSSNAAVVCPAWSPDGKRLTFATILDPARASGFEARTQQDIWTIDADGSNRRRITDGNGASVMPFWAVDNRIYFVSDRGGTDCIWSARVDPAAAPTANMDTSPMHP